jgi:glucose/arabinose dehydrogenase
LRLRVKGNAITGSEDFLTGFLQGNGALGRPVDVIFDKQGCLYVSDDKGGSDI